MNRTELIILLTFSGVGTIAAIFLAVRRIMMRGIAEDVEKTKVRRDKELASAVESLEQIANDIDEWTRQQREKFKHAKIAFRKKWISRWFSDFFIMELFRDKVHKRKFDDIVETFRLYMPNIFESLKEIRHNFLSGAKFMKKTEMQKDKVENGHDLGFWCTNFLDKTARPTVKSLRNAAEKTREYLTAQKQANTGEEQPKKMLSKQVDLQVAQKQAKTGKEQPKEILNKQVDLQVAQQRAKTGKERPKEILDKQVDLQTTQTRAKTKTGKERTKEIVNKQVDLQTARKQAKTGEEKPKEILNQQVDLQAAQKQAKTGEERPKGLLNKQVGILLQSSTDISASEIARILNKNYAGVYKPISPCLVGKTDCWKKHRENIESCMKK